MNNKKLTATLVAVTAAAALLLSGTFAWQSINQTALNEASDVVNPGGRLHNDLNYTDKLETNSDVYVENFAEEPIFARVKISEYFEVIMNYGKGDAERTEILAGSKTEKETEGETDDSNKNRYDYTYATHYFGLTDEEKAAGTSSVERGEVDNMSYTFWDWTTGEGESGISYMPTFNKNKDSLAPDLNGLYVDRVGGISNRAQEQYSEYVDYSLQENAMKTANEIYDGDVNSLDELTNAGVDVLGLINQVGQDAGSYADSVTLVEAEHTAGVVGATKGLISMEDWLTKVEESGAYIETDHGSYWVYDSDGWVYWSSPIAKGSTTGLLLDSFTLNSPMDDTWYYAIQVEGQFVTADDLGKSDSTGFYAEKDERPTVNAEVLLRYFGFELPEATARLYTDVMNLTNANGGIEIDGGWAQNTLLIHLDELVAGDYVFEIEGAGKTWTDIATVTEEQADALSGNFWIGFGGDSEETERYGEQSPSPTLSCSDSSWTRGIEDDYYDVTVYVDGRVYATAEFVARTNIEYTTIHQDGTDNRLNVGEVWIFSVVGDYTADQISYKKYSGCNFVRYSKLEDGSIQLIHEEHTGNCAGWAGFDTYVVADSGVRKASSWSIYASLNEDGAS